MGDLASQARSTANQRLKTASTIKAANDAARLSQLSPQDIDATAATNAAANGGPGDPSQGAFGVSVTLGGSKSSQDSYQYSATQRGSTITGQTVEVRSREGNVEVVGAQITGHDVDLHAAKHLVLSDSKNTTDYTSQNKADSASVGVTVGLGEQNGISFQAGANSARGNGSGSETTGNNAVVHATGHLSYSSGGDTVLNGARLEGESVTGRTGGKLIITSPQDTGSFTSQQSSDGFGVSVCIPPLCYGTPVTGQVSTSDQNVTHSYASTSPGGQSGIFAGQGGYDIEAKGGVELEGGAIVSLAPKEGNRLIAPSITYKDVVNHNDTSASSHSLSLGYGGGSAVSTVADNLSNNVLGNAFNGAGLPKDQHQTSITQSVISPGNITLTGTGNPEVDAQSQKNVQTLTSREPNTADAPLANTLTIEDGKKIQARQQEAQENAQAAQNLGGVMSGLVGDVAQAFGWKDGSWQKTVLHGMAGVIEAKIAGSSAWSGMTVGAANELLTPVLSDYLISQGYLPGSAEFDTMMKAGTTLVGGLVGGATGGSQGAAAGASIAYEATSENYLSHQQKEAFKDALKACNGDSSCIQKETHKWHDIESSQSADANTCQDGRLCAEISGEARSGWGFTENEITTLCAGESSCTEFTTQLGRKNSNDSFAANERATSIPVTKGIDHLIDRGMDPDTAQTIGSVTPADLLGAALATSSGGANKLSQRASASPGDNGGDAGQTSVRTTRSGETAVRITRTDGSVIDISPQRVKEYVPNTDPKAPPGTLDRVKFDNPFPGSKGYKRAPTSQELEILKDKK